MSAFHSDIVKTAEIAGREMDAYLRWLEKNKETLLALYEALKTETGDTATTFDELCRFMYRESRPAASNP